MASGMDKAQRRLEKAKEIIAQPGGPTRKEERKAQILVAKALLAILLAMVGFKE